MEDTHTTTVTIFGRDYKIKGIADENYILEMAKFVDTKMRELSNTSQLPSTERIAILTALNIADELFQEKQKTSEAFSSVEERADQLMTLLDERVLAEK
ncbi:MAG: cell division protein ZapA [bacterium]|nr:cell division protein ZapA [bacterium]